ARTTLSEIQATCDRLAAQLDRPDLDRSDLLEVAHGLEPLARELDRAIHDGTPYGPRQRATAERTLQELWTCLYATRPNRPYAWPSSLRDRLRHALRSVSSTIIALK